MRTSDRGAKQHTCVTQVRVLWTYDEEDMGHMTVAAPPVVGDGCCVVLHIVPSSHA